MKLRVDFSKHQHMLTGTVPIQSRNLQGLGILHILEENGLGCNHMSKKRYKEIPL